MGIWIAVLLTLAMLGSVLWVMPSPREKRLTEMRKLAMSRGLKVRLLDKNLANKLFPWVTDPRGFVLYEKYSRGGDKTVSNQVNVIRLNNEDCHELDRDKKHEAYLEVHGLLSKAPASSEAIAFYSGCVAWLWREQGDVSSVEALADVLDICLSHPYEVAQT